MLRPARDTGLHPENAQFAERSRNVANLFDWVAHRPPSLQHCSIAPTRRRNPDRSVGRPTLPRGALEGLPEENSRYHLCWGSWHGPHVADVPLKDIVRHVLRVKVGAYSIEAANPRHEHEWQLWEKVRLADGRILIPGLVSHCTYVVEHPELVAEHLVRIAKLIGRENVIGGADCGFAQTALRRRVHPSIMWAKLEALVEGSRLASKALWT